MISKVMAYGIIALLIVLWMSAPSFAGPVEVQTIEIAPAEVAIGQRPEITATIKASADAGPVNVIAVLVLPDNIVRSWTWKNVSLRTNEVRKIALPKEYETKLAGVYKVDFNIYSKDMRPLHKLSRNFVAREPSQQPAVASRPPEPTAAKAEGEAADRHFGIGAFGNAVNTAGGATILLWSSKYAGLQGSYSMGNFTTVEGRLLFRFPLSGGFNPYVGIGYMSVSTERTVDVINEKATFRDSGVSGVAGVEFPLGKGIVGYAEVGGASIDLKKDVNSGGFTGFASVDHAPVTLGLGIVWYLF